MSNELWESLSDQSVAAAGIIYFLALLAHSAEWAALRQPKQAKVAAAVEVGASAPAGPAVSAVEQSPAADRVSFFGRLGLLLTIIAAVVHLVAMVGRGMAAEPARAPWGNMYEFALSGSFVVTLTYLVLYKKYRLGWMAPLVVGFVWVILLVSVLVLHDPVGPLTEALNSPWLVIHVAAALIATAAFTVGGIAAIMYLVKLRTGDAATGWLARVPGLDALDKLSYRIHAFAFPVWTFGVLIAGPIWAHEAWSRYWSWDPKEVWAFITWVVYAGYLHARATAGWKGRNAAILALIGLLTLWFNFIGINYFATNSQHSYADVPTVVVSEVGVG